MNFFKAVMISSILFIVGCQSETVLKGGGYTFVHFNNPECMGQSGAGGILARTQKEVDEILSASMSFKTGYCESLTGQAIAVGGEVAGKALIGEGLKKSGQSDVRNISAANSNGDNIAEEQFPEDVPEELPQ